MSDKRNDERFPVIIPVLVYFGENEVEGRVLDVSMHGIGILLPLEQVLCDPQKMDILPFQFIDQYQFGQNLETRILNEDCLVRHLEQDGEFLRVGGSVKGRDYLKYVYNRELAFCSKPFMS